MSIGLPEQYTFTRTSMSALDGQNSLKMTEKIVIVTRHRSRSKERSEALARKSHDQRSSVSHLRFVVKCHFHCVMHHANVLCSWKHLCLSIKHQLSFDGVCKDVASIIP